MNKNFIIGILILLIVGLFWMMHKGDFPFKQLLYFNTFVVIATMSLIRRRLVYFLAVTLILGFGLFLIVHAFLMVQTSRYDQIDYIYVHLLFSCIIICTWILFSYSKSIGDANEKLHEQVQKLQRYTEYTNILTIPEFQEQARWALTSVRRNQTQAWLIELQIGNVDKLVQQNLQETMESIALEAIRSRFDLVTSSRNHIYILLKDTHEKGTEIVLERIKQHSRNRLNLVEHPFSASMSIIENETFLEKIGEEQL
ncbi:hypothetical protein [Salibacterium lacus]|uniref:GGDEF domain-containing protein n=1 Tax=Salibacterium lacus TaxID=1898109 RepID=A0ABW5T615_9BACI